MSRFLWRRVQRDERGIITDLALAAALLGITLLVSAGIAIAGPRGLDKWRAERNAARDGRVTGPATPSTRFIPEVFRDIGAPPTENPQCVADVLASHYPTLKWNGFSWVDSGDPAPAANAPNASEWRGRMSARVGAATALFKQENCDRAPVEIRPPIAPPGEDNTELVGTYTLVQSGNPTAECKNVLPTTLRVTGFQSGSDMNIELTSASTDAPSGAYLATINSGRSFRLDVPEKYFSMNGTFITRSSEIVVEGTFSYNVGGGCGIPYEGTKTRQGSTP